MIMVKCKCVFSISCNCIVLFFFSIKRRHRRPNLTISSQGQVVKKGKKGKGLFLLKVVVIHLLGENAQHPVRKYNRMVNT